MNNDTVGTAVRLRLFGASHAPELGFELEGIPAGLAVDPDALRGELERRSAAAYGFATGRREADEPIIEAGLENGVTTGGVIRMSFKNRAYDRSEYRPVARPSHADYAAFVKSGGGEDISGGGRYSGRMTLPMTAAGAVCRQLLRTRGIEVFGHIAAIGELKDAPFDPMLTEKPDMDRLFPLVDPSLGAGMKALIEQTRREGDTLSCEAEVAVTGLPVGLGEPLANGVEGTLSRLLFMIPGLRGVSFGELRARGSLMNDCFGEGGRTLTNRSGGVNGGMANGMPLIFRCAFRPVPSISLPQTGFDLIEKKPVPLTITGRHDTCILPRGLAAVEAAAALGTADLLMMGEENG